MSEENKTKTILRLSSIAKELNISTTTACEELGKAGFSVENTIHQKLTQEMYEVLLKRFGETKTNTDKITKTKKDTPIIIPKPILLPFGNEDIGENELISPQELKASMQKKAEALKTMDALTENVPAKIETIIPPTIEENTPIKQDTETVKLSEQTTDSHIEITDSYIKTKEEVTEIKEEVKETPILSQENITPSDTLPTSNAVDEKNTTTTDTPNKVGLTIVGKIDLEDRKESTKDKKSKPKKQPKLETPSLFDQSQKFQEVIDETLTKEPIVDDPTLEIQQPHFEEVSIENITTTQPTTPEPLTIETDAQHSLEKNKEETPETKHKEIVLPETIITQDIEKEHYPETSAEDNSISAKTEPEIVDIEINTNLPESKTEPDTETEIQTIRAKDHTPKLEGLTIIGKIDLKDPKAKKSEREKTKLAESKEKLRQAKEEKTTKETKASLEADKKKRKRRLSTNTPPSQQKNTGTQNPQFNRQNRDNNNNNRNKGQTNQPNNQGNRTNTNNNNNNNNSRPNTQAPNNNFLGNFRPRRGKKPIKKDKRKNLQEQNLQLESNNILEVTEYLSANELANLMEVSVNEVIAKCLQLGLFVSINQRINADVIQLVAEEFGYEVRFITLEESEEQEEEETDQELLESRPPIVTVMGHVDHGKTSLLDYIRKTNVIAGESGGITQHIGAYEVELENNRRITFLDTPGHEAFTAMRARGAQITDIAIIVIAADDQIMPQTREAINHAQAAGVPMVFAINKIDKDGANPEKIKEQLAGMNLLVEDWGGKYQSQEISAKAGININLLLEKVLLEADLLNLKANPDRLAKGTVIESQLDKGKGIVTTVLVQTGTLSIGDVIVAGSYFGKVKALMNERGVRVKTAGPSTPVQILGLNGSSSAGDKIQVYESEREAREIATRRQQLLREQNIRQQKHITLEEIARRKAIGTFRELNIIVKGDVDGSVEALSDSLLKLTTGEVSVNIVHKGVGQISESDVMLATASDAIIIGFNVRPSQGARKVAETEQIDIRIYSIIYAAIDEVKDALEGMLAPSIEEEILGVVEIREVFKISKIGTIAGCMVTEGKISRQNQIRVIREGVVIYSSRLASLKRFKDDVKEVSAGFDCGLSVENFNDIKIGDIIESYATKEVKRKLI